jgi:antitoxin component of RelBE/YafQ-DinJ toxin-antitoxin module
MAESRFISLTRYCLVEYIFEPIGSPNFLNDDVILLKNDRTDSYQIYNTDASNTSTKNIKDLSVAPIGNNKQVYLDSEKIPNYVDYDDSLTETSITGFNVIYDRVRFHFVSGFDFSDFEALILGIQNKQNNGEKHVFANILFSNVTSDNLLTFNSKPLFISDSLYDRFIEIKVPSVKNINEEFVTSLNQALTFSANITPTDTGYSGFIYNSPIDITISECARKEELSTDVGVKYDVFDITDNYSATLSQTNEFDNVGTYIGESAVGDYIEYYLTWNGGFPEELISILNRRNPSDDWVIIHQLSVFEQIGSTFINTSRQVIFQEDDWDEPLVYRPVLKNAGSAVSMSIDILTRLTNKRNGEQIIREGSFTLLSPKKYGKKLIQIPLSDEPQSQKVYNKIIKKDFESTRLFIEPTFAPGFRNSPAENLDVSTPNVVKSTEYIPIYYNNNNISISNNSGSAKIKDDADEIIFGPGKLRFMLTPFDNVIKLKVYNVINKKALPLDLNVNEAKYRLVFETDNGKVSIENANSDSLENLSNGEVAFTVPTKDSEQIVKSIKKTVYLTSVAQEGTETLLYTGEWRDSANQSDIDTAISSAKNEVDTIKNREDKITSLEAKLKTIEADLTKKKFDTSRNKQVKKKAAPSVVNRIGMPSPKKIRTNTSNAGFKSKKSEVFSSLAKKIKPER